MHKRKYYSISQKTVRSTVLNCIIFGLAAQILALAVYASALTKQYVNMAHGIAQQARQSAVHAADTVSIANQVMKIYQSLGSEEREKVGTEEYRAYFSDVDTETDGCPYDTLIHILGGALGCYKEIYDCYLAMYDRETSTMVYIVDPDISADRLMPGDWESVNEKGMLKFLKGSPDDLLYDSAFTENYGLLCTVAAPIQDKNGETAAFVLVDISMNNIISGMMGFAWKFSLAIVLLTLLTALIQSKRIKRSLVEPINQIAQTAQLYVADGNTDEHFAKLDIHTGDELEQLVLTMADMEHSLKEYGTEMLRVTAETERINTELALAEQIQSSMLPQIFPPYPDRNEFDIYAMMKPARAVGGDFYDFFLLDNDHLCLVIADVSGKGIPAALFMMISKAVIHNCAMIGLSPSEILTNTNNALCANNHADMFVTVWLGILEISTGRLTCANAGHEYPALKRKNGKFELYKDKHSFAVGGMEGMRYKEYELELNSGDTLFVYTDGVPEANDADNRMFGTERMISALNQTAESSPRELLHNVRNAISEFAGDAEQFDDLTMLGLSIK